MCGFYGAINYRGSSINIRTAFARITYRGSIAGYYNHNHSHFFAIRLPRKGNRERSQPVVTNISVLMFNGEIYNINYLCKKNKINLTSEISDTEALILLIEKKGVEIIDEIIGEFSIFYYNKINEVLVLARDRIGTKPLFWSIKNDTIVAASSSSSVSESFNYCSINQEIVNDYLYYGVSNKSTIYDKIFEVKAGYVYIFDKCLNLNQRKLTNKNINIDQIYKELNAAISIRIDSTSYISYSGGTDSAIIDKLSMYKEALFSLETPFESINTTSRSSIYKPTWEDIDVYFDLYNSVAETPITSISGIALLYLHQQAKNRGFENVITGEAADEIFGGYQYYYQNSKGHPLMSSRDKSRLFVQSILEFNSNYKKNNIFKILQSEDVSDWSQFDICNRLPNHLLRLNSDLPSLLAGIEARVPFLDLYGYYTSNFVFKEMPKSELRSILKKDSKSSRKINSKIGLYFPASIIPEKWFIEKINEIKFQNYTDLIGVNKTTKSKLLSFYKSYKYIKDINKDKYYYHISRWGLGLISLSNYLENKHHQLDRSSNLSINYTNVSLNENSKTIITSKVTDVPFC
jgi:asparagine synthase (glutamine-hydrolysing)